MLQPDHGDFYQWLISVGKWVVSIFIGVIAKISHVLTSKQKLTMLEWVAVVGLSIFVGYLSAVWCSTNNFVVQGYFIVPVATLLGEKIVAYATDNFRPIISRIIDAILNKKK
jgi:hypothetical protein